MRRASTNGSITSCAAMTTHADAVANYRAGKTALLGFFVGQTMKAMQGKANPKLVNDVLKARLG